MTEAAFYPPMTGADLRGVREQTHLSQAALARLLNISAGYVSRLERGRAEATGPTLAVFHLIRRRGLEVLL
jgi:putative transcriptional regulator